jgi:hypothetical protein
MRSPASLIWKRRRRPGHCGRGRDALGAIHTKTSRPSRSCRPGPEGRPDGGEARHPGSHAALAPARCPAMKVAGGPASGREAPGDRSAPRFQRDHLQTIGPDTTRCLSPKRTRRGSPRLCRTSAEMHAALAQQKPVIRAGPGAVRSAPGIYRVGSPRSTHGDLRAPSARDLCLGHQAGRAAIINPGLPQQRATA